MEKTENNTFFYIRKLQNIQDRILLIKQKRVFTKEDLKIIETNNNIVLTCLKSVYFK